MGVDIKYRTPGETEAMHTAFIAGLRAGYRRSKRSAQSAYCWLTGQDDSSAPVLTALVPDTAEIGSEDFYISIQGRKFDENTVIWWKDHPEPTTLVSPTEVTTLVRPDTIGAPETLPISVRNGVVSSNVLDFDFTDPAP